MNKSKKILCGIFGLHLAGGILEATTALGAEPQVIAVALWVPLTVLLFMWCKADTAERNIDSPPGATLLVGLVAPIGVPYYFFRALRWQKAAIATMLALLTFVGMQATWQLGVFMGESL